jgi:hypothetical protein
MANVLPIIHKQGPLPLSATVEVVSDGAVALMFSGSVWTGTPDSLIGIKVLLDGVQVATASIFANPKSTHMAVVSSVIPIKTRIGPHKFEIVALNGATISDFNDTYSLTLLY